MSANEGSNLLRVMVGSSSEPQTGGVLPPLKREYRLGRILVKGPRVVGVTPIGLEGLGESFVRSGSNRVDFFATTRGDEDGVLIELDAWQPGGEIIVDIYEAPHIDPSGRGLVSSANPLWGEARIKPDKDRLLRFKIPLADLDAGPQSRSHDPNGYVRIERVAGDLERYREFAFDVIENIKPDGENYVYVRVEQIDDERAWSSPVWVTWRKETGGNDD